MTVNNRLSGNSTDAKEWAEYFCEHFAIAKKEGLNASAGYMEIASMLDDSLGLMIGWFANAIETGRMAGEKKTEPLDQDLQDALRVIMILVKRLGGSAVITDADILAEYGRLVRYENDNPLGGFNLHYMESEVGPVLDFRYNEEDDEDEEEDDDDDYPCDCN